MSFDASELWLVDLVASGPALALIDGAMGLVGDAERASCARLTDAAVRGERLAAHAALRLILARAFGADAGRQPFKRSIAGRPTLPGVAGGFSLAHVPGAALIGVCARGSIGVDLELAARPLPSPDARWSAIRAAGDALVARAADSAQVSLIGAWVRLEAVAKARGSGIGRLLGELGARARAPDAAAAARAAAALTGRGAAGAGLMVVDLAVPSGFVGAAAFCHGAAGTAEWRTLPHDLPSLREFAAADRPRSVRLPVMDS